MFNTLYSYLFNSKTLIWASLGLFLVSFGLVVPTNNPTWGDISTIATSNITFTTNTKFRSNPETANRYCRELGGLLNSYTEIQVPNKIQLVEYKPAPINWTYNQKDKYINYIVCDIMTNTLNNGTGANNINITVQNNKPSFNSDHLIQLLEGVVTNPATWKLTVIYIINFMNLLLLWYCVKYAFKGGVLFIKNKM